MSACPCGSGDDYAGCCGRWHGGDDAPTALALMRSRYTAYARRDLEYLRRTWHLSTVPRPLTLDEGIEWQRLHIADVEDGGPDDDTGVVEFVARYRTAAGPATLRERSEFVRGNGRWRYLRGDVR